MTLGKLISQHLLSAAIASAALVFSGAGAHAQGNDFDRVPNAAISGHNNKKLTGVTAQTCMVACVSERGFVCKSFDYDKVQQACDLSDKSASDVGGLKRDYPNNPYDHYARRFSSLTPVVNTPVIQPSQPVQPIRPVQSVIGDNEKSPAVSDFLKKIQSMHGEEAEVIETDLTGWTARYGDAIQQGDHVQGIAMTASGRIVLSYSRQGSSRENCKGMVAVSSPFNANNPNQKLNWTYNCLAFQNGGLEGHPSNVQASGEVIAVGTSGGSRYYFVQSNGSLRWLPNLSTDGGRDASGLVYHPGERRFYTLNAHGKVTPGQANMKLCRSTPGVSMFDTNFRFDDCKIFPAYVSGQSSNLIMSTDGRMYLVSAFSTDSESPYADDWTAYGVACQSQAAALGLAGYSMSTDFEDVLYVSEVNFDRASANVVYNKNISRTQRATACVHQRPAFRFSGGVMSYGNGELIGLWSGRQNPPVLKLSDDYEFAFQKLDGTTSARRDTYALAIDCQVDDVDNEGTSNTITAQFLDANRTVLGSASQKDISAFNCATEWIDFETELTSAPKYVKVSTNGSDGFLIDRVELSKNGTTLKSYGANNDQGWCLSTDSGDGAGSWARAANGICVQHHTWSFDGSSVSGNPYDIALANAGNAQVNIYELDIDCDVSGGVDNEHTGNTLSVIFQDSNYKSLGRAVLGGGEDGLLGCTDRTAKVSVRGNASYVRFETNGSDGAMLDEITVYKNGSKIKVFGDSDDKGWCLSTQESDAHGSWQGHTEGNTCKSAFSFKL